MSAGIIVHYHLFKNAGSSVDHLLNLNFADKWMPYDRTTANAIITTVELEKLIEDNPNVRAVSSHQVVPPLPELEQPLYPVVFLRDPIDRVKSAYLFEWKKQLGLDEPKGTLEQYVKEKFTKRRHNAIEEFQSIRLSNVSRNEYHKVSSKDDAEFLENSTAFIRSLSFLGIVDQFDRSALLLKEYLKPSFPDFKIHEAKANVLQDITLTQDQKRLQIKTELGAEMYETVLHRNLLDETLYQTGKEHFEALCKKSLVAPFGSVAA